MILKLADIRNGPLGRVQSNALLGHPRPFFQTLTRTPDPLETSV